MKKSSYHVVNEAVEYTKKTEGRYAAGFVNAILRGFIRGFIDNPETKTKTSSVSTKPSVEIRNISTFYSFPEWIVKRWHERFGAEETEKLCLIMNTAPYFTLRIDERKMKVEDVAEYLEKKDIKTERGRYLETALYVERLTPVLRDNLFKKGIIFIQDESSQLAGISVQPADGDIILDACAGVGTKTRHIKEIADNINVFSMDINTHRLRLIDNKGKILKGDVLHHPFKQGSFDIILLDAPCSSMGIIRKHPEVKWRLKEKDIHNYGTLQLKMLNALWDSLKTGGYLIYSVCSFEPEETIAVIKSFGKQKEFILENPFPFLFNKEYFLSLPHKTDMDGFFIARLKKL